MWHEGRASSPPVTIAGGRILDPRPPRSAIRTAAALDRLRRLDTGAVADRREADVRAAAVMIEAAGLAGLTVAALVSRAGIDPPDVADRIAALAASKAAVHIGDLL